MTDAPAGLKELLIATGDVPWREKSLEGLHEKLLWRNEETGATIALVRFEEGVGIPSRHVHGSNQFMFCLEGTYEYLEPRLVLTPGSFYMNPKGNPHGPTVARTECVLLEIYDGPHYLSRPDWYTNDDDAR